MKIIKNNFWRIILNILALFILAFCLFYDLSLSNINFPFLTTIFFIVFITARFLKPIFRKFR